MRTDRALSLIRKSLFGPWLGLDLGPLGSRLLWGDCSRPLLRVQALVLMARARYLLPPFGLRGTRLASVSLSQHVGLSCYGQTGGGTLHLSPPRMEGVWQPGRVVRPSSVDLMGFLRSTGSRLVERLACTGITRTSSTPESQCGPLEPSLLMSKLQTSAVMTLAGCVLDKLMCDKSKCIISSRRA